MRSTLTLSAPSPVAALVAAGLFATGPALAQAVKTVPTSAGPVEVSRFADGLERPWGIDFLPDGRALVTEKPGRLRIMARDGSLSPPLAGTPKVFAQGQGGLMDVAADPDFARNRTVYLAYAEPGENGTTGTALGRGTLGESGIEDFQVIFRQSPKVDGGNHFGTRIAFAPDGHIFLTLGERYKFDPAQKRDNTLGKVVRLNRDGSLPKDNPFAGEGKTAGAIWSYGHRNIEAAAIDPRSGSLWIGEMGPLGGDELNRPEAGRNYGWPVVSWGKHYDGRDIPDPPTRKDFADAAVHWTPVISPSGMVFYTGGLFRDWQGSALLGGLSARGLVRVAIDGSSAKEVERIPLDARIRDVAQGPDDALYVITDAADGVVLRLAPAK
ncbi:PQQ-dependent sugar dehydrogenase [Azospirillum sp. TSA2s]|uniref:PQQ-dependent sugar dehydrogenase n=1 Tax=Azospirillum sp. TSA2s TaxID=709810 RepID=UPI0010AA9913|nr:PQQ-dependent sugar dehydrogenase [Azospirillum sp. TSA2s]QCG95932.1 PQQ-dependent sugar dehydrogenase [Azospirillum sp. TSA2s]